MNRLTAHFVYYRGLIRYKTEGRIRYWRARLHEARGNWRLGLAYARGTLTEEDAAWMRYQLKEVAGEYPLETLYRDQVLEDAVERWGNNPALPNLVRDACDHVGRKWTSDGNLSSAAKDWAFDEIVKYAESDKIELLEQEAV